MVEIDLSLTLTENIEKLVAEATEDDPELGTILRDAIGTLSGAYDEKTRRSARNDFYRIVNERLDIELDEIEQDS